MRGTDVFYTQNESMKTLQVNGLVDIIMRNSLEACSGEEDCYNIMRICHLAQLQTELMWSTEKLDRTVISSERAL